MTSPFLGPGLGLAWPALFEFGFQGLHKGLGHIKARLGFDFLEARGAGDVDFGQVIPNDIEAHQKQSAPGQQCPTV